MKKIVPILVALILVSGCASTELKNSVTTLQDRVSSVERQLADALSAAKSADAKAAQANAAADRAMKAANDASEKAERIAGSCCSPK